MIYSSTINSPNLSRLIDSSINLIKKAENLALHLSPEHGFWVAFSGGKDSQVMYELVKMAGVRHTAIYNVTTNDPADNVRFIKKYYPEVQMLVPKESLLQMISHKGLPSMFRRYCCERLKERTGAGHVVVTGVRREESLKRAAYAEFSKMQSDIPADKRKSYNLDSMEERNFECVKGKDKFLVHPILEWKETDIWAFLRLFNIPINPCYDLHRRVGCVICPFALKGQITTYLKSHPKLRTALLHSIQAYIDRSPDTAPFPDAEVMFEWWLSKKSISEFKALKKQTTLNFD